MNIPNFTKEHADFILEHIDVSSIRARKFKQIRAAASKFDDESPLPQTFDELGDYTRK